MSDLRLSQQLSALLRGYQRTPDSRGQSPARVYALTGRQPTLYLKTSDLRCQGTAYDVEREKDLLLWLQGRLPVPEVLHYEEHDGVSFLLMSAADGTAVCEDFRQQPDPERLARHYAEAVRLLRSVSILDCPYPYGLDQRLQELEVLLARQLMDVERTDWEDDTPFADAESLAAHLQTHRPPEEWGFTHGDLGRENLFVRGGRISGFIDVGRSGVADPWMDIALCVRSLQHICGGRREPLDLFFNLLEIEPDWDKIRYYIWLDELF